MPTKRGAKKPTGKKPTKTVAKKGVSEDPHRRGTHDFPWDVWVNDHPERKNSSDYIRSRKKMNELARKVADFYYGDPNYEDHHGGGLWVKDEDGWFIVRNLVGMEWAAQYCADPKKVDQLRINARRLYARFPEAVEELGIRKLLDTPIKDAEGVAAWTDSICNASLPLPEPLHVGTLPKPGEKSTGKEVWGGFHFYPAPVVEQQLFKYDDFDLWVTEDDEPVAVVPVAKRGSADGRTAVIYATPGSRLAAEKDKAARKKKALILSEDDELSLRAFNNQYAKVFNGKVAPDDPLAHATAAFAAKPARRVPASRYRII